MDVWLGRWRPPKPLRPSQAVSGSPRDQDPPNNSKVVIRRRMRCKGRYSAALGIHKRRRALHCAGQ